MYRTLCFFSLSLFLVSCAGHKTNSADARHDLEVKYSNRLGSAKKADLVEQFGSAESCTQKEGGGEICRFYNKKGTKWVGDNKRDKKSYETFDEIVADFDASGTLQAFKANAQR